MHTRSLESKLGSLPNKATGRSPVILADSKLDRAAAGVAPAIVVTAGSAP